MVARTSILLWMFCTTITAPLGLCLYLLYEDQPDQLLYSCVTTIAQAWLAFCSWLTPTVLFCLMNVVVLALACTSGFHQQLFQLKNIGSDDHPNAGGPATNHDITELDPPVSDPAPNFYPELSFFGEGKLVNLAKAPTAGPICTRRRPLGPGPTNRKLNNVPELRRPIVPAKPIKLVRPSSAAVAGSTKAVTSNSTDISSYSSSRTVSGTSSASNSTNNSSYRVFGANAATSGDDVLNHARIGEETQVSSRDVDHTAQMVNAVHAPLASKPFTSSDAYESKDLDVDKRADDFIGNFYKRMKQQ